MTSEQIVDLVRRSYFAVETTFHPHSLVPMEWFDSDRNRWCIFNADGSLYVDWGAAEKLASYQEPARTDNLILICCAMLARLLISAKGKFTEVSLEEATRIAEDAAASRALK